jgi:hypothetical protein
VIPVKVHYVQGAVTTIGKELEPGDLVVTDGQDQLTAGTAVKVASSDERDGDHETPPGGVQVSESQ